MFKRQNILLTLCCTALLSGCASTPINFWYTSTEQLIERHHYQKAIEQINATRPIDSVLLTKVEKLAKQHRQKQTSKIKLWVKQKQWGEAREILKQLNTNQPNITSLSQLKLLVDKAQFEEERVINTQRALLEAQLLAIRFIQQNLSERIHHRQKNWLAENIDLMTQKQRLATKLLRLSTQALLVKDYRSAQQAYERAIKLDHTLGKGEITQAINSGLSQQNNKAINKRSRSLVKQLYAAISKQDFKSLFHIQEILSHAPFYGAEVKRVLQAAKKTRAEHSYTLDEVASKQYRNGNISLAVIQWQQALRLTPANIGIQERLIRAQKVQRKLNKLTSAEESPL